ncbi:peptidylprolyl isomerase [Leucobacter sp. HY1908]
MLRRVIPATAVSALLIAGITGCSAQQAAPDCTPGMQPGALSDNVTVDGGFDAAPAMQVPGDITIETSQRTVIDEASDRSVVAGEQSLVGVNMAFFDSATGEQIYQSPAFGSAASPEFLLVDEAQSNPLSESVRCLAAGDRAVLALGPAEGAQLSAQLGGSGQGSVVGIVDVQSVSPLAVQGKTQGLPNGYPAVVTNDEGRPGVVLPPREAPQGTTSAVRIAGTGAEVTADNNVIAQLLEVGWDGQERTNTWETGLMGLGNEEQIAQSGFTYRAALTGQQVGSQVVVIENLEEGTPRVLVIDILGVN